ncbi:T9SS type A sorting domain-containing protein [Lunatimonas lonarensis]|uniref:T9SS type A sorting domain-containing protein n=1 Tax=Lunatimonas lonarensis TaxID=1232681 RepID=UPI0012DF1226|nr:T9SS type A sorting domain-containing protein [Lunatimonas lonarensis]
MAAQEIYPVEGSYRTNLSPGGSGVWSDPLIWLEYDGIGWVSTASPPGRYNDVFILRGHEVVLTGHEEVGNLYLFGQGESPGRKLNLQSYDLSIFGALRSLGENSGGEWILHPNAHPSTDWIYPETGSLVFRGASRTVVDRNSWSGVSNYSRFTVRFSPDPDATLVVNAAMKATEFIIESGTVLQTLNTNGTPATSTFSFNIHNSFGAEAFGSLTVRSGATLISEASAPSGQILRRTGTRPAASFILEEGGGLILLGDRPQLEAELVQLQGTVIYNYDGDGQQRMLAPALLTSQTIDSYNNIYFEGNGAKLLPMDLFLTGDLVASGGPVIGGTTHLTLIGAQDQRVDWPGFFVSDLSVVKDGGTIMLEQDVTVARDFRMLGGNMDFGGNSLVLNTSMIGSYEYTGGFWLRLNSLTINNIHFDGGGSGNVYPFFDDYLAAPRTIRLHAESVPSNQTITIAHIQTPGTTLANGLIDEDGTEIYYLMNSHFSVAHAGSHTGELEIWIQGDDMLLNDVSDLRVAGNGTAATGFHVEAALEGSRIWAKRSVSFEALQAAAFALASTEPLSLLPIEWRSFSAVVHDGNVQLAWQTKVGESTRFTILRAEDASLDFRVIYEFDASASDESFFFLDNQPLPFNGHVYYQVLAWDQDALISASPVTSVRTKRNVDDLPIIFPNPYLSGDVQVRIPDRAFRGDVRAVVHDSRGKLWMDVEIFSREDAAIFGTALTGYLPGIYFIRLVAEDLNYSMKWIKKY